MFSIKSPRNYYQLAGIRAQAGDYLSPLSQHIYIISSTQAWQAVNPELEKSLQAAGIRYRLALLTTGCTDEATERLTAEAQQEGASLILGVGGGQVLDVAKAVGNALIDNSNAAGDTQAGIAIVTMPTLAATCAAWSPVTIIYDEKGGHLRSQPLGVMPELVLVDSEVIARSDVRYLKAGIVDALAKWYEFQPYQQHNPDSLALDMKALVARRAVDVFLAHGAQALVDNQQQRVSPALIKTIDACIALAGMANSLRDSLPTPGFAHAIHNRLTHLPELHDWLHGEKVGFSLLVQSIMQHPDGKPDAELLALLRQYDAPLTLSPLTGERGEAIRTLAHGIKFPPACAARLPFEISPQALEKALLATEIG